MFAVVIPKKVHRSLERLTEDVQSVCWLLINKLREKRAIRKEWANFSVLGKNTYHCHVKRKYIVCWAWERKSIVIDVYYVGSREGVPY
jgi:hypothetical protein